jgi:hypothetical protein
MAFCIRVSAILGYKQNDALFNRGYGQPIADSAYGAVAIGAAESVEAHARQYGRREESSLMQCARAISG